MDIQTSNDHLQRGIKTHQINEWHRNIAKINKIINFQVSDLCQEEYCNQLFTAAQILHNLVSNEKRKVFLHCTAGVSRGPTLMIVYLSLYLKHKDWDNLDKIYDYVEAEFEWQDANITVAKKVIEQNKAF